MKVAEYLPLLTSENINVVFQSLIRALAVRLDERYQMDTENFDKRVAVGRFETSVDRTLAARQYVRLPDPNLEMFPECSLAKVTSLADIILTILRGLSLEEALNFLGELTGAWMLSCPAILIRQDNVAINKEPKPLETETDLIQIMRLWLAQALDVGN